MHEDEFDLAVIGGGINGCGIVRDAAGRGVKSLLCEMSDLASATSSASTKLVHGGLRYLEFGEFSLVRQALAEREILMRIAPHLIRPMRFILPHRPEMRAAWILRIGLFLYDRLAQANSLPPSQAIDLRRHSAGKPLADKWRKYRRGFCYSDCWADDSRLVVANAISAREKGATILTRTKFIRAVREKKFWRIFLQSESKGELESRARILINAAGPWIGGLDIESASVLPTRIRLVKGSHIIVPKIFGGEDAYILQNSDGRIIFAIPYEGRFTLLGTTDADFCGDPADAAADDSEIEYLCGIARNYFQATLSPADVIATFSGVRPLADDGNSAAQKASRDYELHLDSPSDSPPLLTVVGGKLTTYRRLAEAALHKISPHLGDSTNDWTADSPLPGGDFQSANQLAESLANRYAFLSANWTRRLAFSYGTRAFRMLGDAESIGDLGAHFGGNFYECEADYMHREEWAETAADALFRRSKLYLHLDDAAKQKVADWFGRS